MVVVMGWWCVVGGANVLVVLMWWRCFMSVYNLFIVFVSSLHKNNNINY